MRASERHGLPEVRPRFGTRELAKSKFVLPIVPVARMTSGASFRVAVSESVGNVSTAP